MVLAAVLSVQAQQIKAAEMRVPAGLVEYIPVEMAPRAYLLIRLAGAGAEVPGLSLMATVRPDQLPVPGELHTEVPGEPV